MIKSSVNILAIETSFDETAVAILRGKLGTKNPEFKLLSSIVNSQIEIHKNTGGVIPEIAARAHVKNIVPAVQQTLDQASMTLDDIDYFAVTSGPGLIVSLAIGVEFVKALSLATGKKIIPTNHMAGHLYSAFTKVNDKGQIINSTKSKFPAVSLIVSGGHTMLMLLKDYKHHKLIGGTLDDAAGEAFDKVSRLLGLPFPGGPVISKLAEKGNPDFVFPRPMLNQKNLDFSFSGLKTSVRNFIHDNPKAKKADIARAFEDAVIDTLVTKTLRAAKKHKAKTVSLAGGVAANKKLRAELAAACAKETIEFTMPSFELCTDNAQMIAIAAYMRLLQGFKPVSFEKVKADPSWELE